MDKLDLNAEFRNQFAASLHNWLTLDHVAHIMQDFDEVLSNSFDRLSQRTAPPCTEEAGPSMAVLVDAIKRISFCWNMGEIKRICAETLPNPVPREAVAEPPGPKKNWIDPSAPVTTTQPAATIGFFHKSTGQIQGRKA